MTDEQKRAKVIAGLEWMAESYIGLVSNISKDALVLLKAQEPIEARLNLCESCTKEYAECEADKTDLVYGSGVGNDNVIGCPWYVNRWKAQEPRIVTEADFENADEAGFIPAWCEEKDAGEVYCECISIGALEDAKFGRVRWWTFRPTDEQREAVPWFST